MFLIVSYLKALPIKNLKKFCLHSWKYRRVNSGCNNEKCLFDGNDCRNQLTCNPHFKDYCELNYDNGHCDQGCNNAACNWDGNDCTNYVPMNNLKGTMIAVDYDLYIILTHQLVLFRASVYERVNSIFDVSTSLTYFHYSLTTVLLNNFLQNPFWSWQ
jgi:hypothetical protein